jgi:hypothetical protein
MRDLAGYTPASLYRNRHEVSYDEGTFVQETTG